MNSLQSDLVNILAGFLFCAAGLLAAAISLFRLKNRDFTLLNFGLFGFLYGLRKLVETPTMETLVSFPFTFPYFHGLLTYALVIPFSAFLVNIFGGGLYNSMLWVFWSTIVYALGAMACDLLRPGPIVEVAIYRPLVVLWAFVWIVNLIVSRKKRDIELRILQGVFLATLSFVLIDQLISMNVLSWGFRLEQPGFAVLFFGLGFVAVHHFFVNEQRLYAVEQEIEIARRIQESNLPAKLLLPKGIDVAARYVPMSTVAGDFYDIQANDEAGVGIVIADVSGHGIGAALIGSMLKVCFASQVPRIADPAHVLTEINRILHGRIESSFVTACAVFIDFKNGVLRYSIAGHPPPILWRKSGSESIRLTHAGTLLGPFPDLVYENEELRLAKGDRLILYTDGLVETRSKTGEFFGDDRLEAVVRAHAEDSPELSADQIIAQVVRWSGRSAGKSLDDDLTLLVADVLAEAQAPVPTAV